MKKSWETIDYTADETTLVQLMNAGAANEGQQKQFLAFVVNRLCRTYDVSFDPESPRASDFAEGRRFVGLQLVTMTKLNVSALREREKQARAKSERAANKDAKWRTQKS